MRPLIYALDERVASATPQPYAKKRSRKMPCVSSPQAGSNLPSVPLCASCRAWNPSVQEPLFACYSQSGWSDCPRVFIRLALPARARTGKIALELALIFVISVKVCDLKVIYFYDFIKTHYLIKVNNFY